MPVPEITANFAGKVNTVTIGSVSGGTRTSEITVGGAANAVYGGCPDDGGHRPVIVMDVLDSPPQQWPDALKKPFADVLNDADKWAEKCVEQFGADMICIKYGGSDPDKAGKDISESVDLTRRVLESVGVPLVLWGSGNNEIDNELMPKISEACKGERCLIGTVTEDNYKAITAIALADGHNLITEAPLDINIGKQVNILVTDMGFPLERIVSYQTTGALGYGIEYSYSIQERQRLAALSGDKMMSTPVICDIGYESWKVKEGRAPNIEGWGDIADRGPMWEAATAVTLLQSGADMLRMRHPRAVKAVRDFIDQIWI